RDREQHSTWELFSYREYSNKVDFAVSAVDKIYAHESLFFNNTVASKRNVLGMKIVRDQSGSTLSVSRSRFYNEKLIQTLLEGHSILSLEGRLSGTVIWKRMTNVKFFFNFDYAMGRSITVMAGYMTLTEPAKEAIWLKGLAIKSGLELKIVAGIATGALSKGIPGPRWPPKVTLGRLLPHARGFGFKPRREGFSSGVKKEWGLSLKAKVRVLHTAQLDVTTLIMLCLLYGVGYTRWPPRATLGRLLPHARGLGFKPRRGGFPSGAKKEWGLSPKAKVRVLHTAQLDVTVSSNH
nr:zinc finger, CCHC-type [Tanacetum cinerariifolium]